MHIPRAMQRYTNDPSYTQAQRLRFNINPDAIPRVETTVSNSDAS